MDCSQFLPTDFVWIIPLLVILFIWEVVLKLLAMWKAAQRKELLWFVLIAIFNTLGILPLLYLIITKDKNEEKTT